MSAHSSNEYLRNAVLTATAEQLQLMLYDGAIRFTRQAREAMQKADWEASCDKLIRAQKIVSEMQSSLRPEHNPSLCEQLAGLYAFVFRSLVQANLTHEIRCLDEALQILEHQRETWRMLLEKVNAREIDGMSQRASVAKPEFMVHG